MSITLTPRKICPKQNELSDIFVDSFCYALFDIYLFIVSFVFFLLCFDFWFCVFVGFCLFLGFGLSFLFDRDRTQSWIDKEVGRIWEELGEGKMIKYKEIIFKSWGLVKNFLCVHTGIHL